MTYAVDSILMQAYYQAKFLINNSLITQKPLLLKNWIIKIRNKLCH